MKRKLLSLLVIFLMIIAMTGCQTTDSSSKDTEATTSQPDHRETIAERLGVEPHYKAEYISDTAISVVTVDAEVVVPEAYTVDIVKALPRAFTDEEILSFIERHMEGLTWIDQATQEPYDGHGPKKDPQQNASELGYDMFHLWIYNREEFDAGRDHHDIHVLYGLNTRTGKLAWAPELEYLKSRYNLDTSDLLPLTDGKALGCSITLEEARAYADAEVQSVCPDYALTAYGQLPAPKPGNSQMPAAGTGNPQYYIFRYTRHINGIPVNDDYGGEGVRNDYDYTSGLGVITVIVDDDGVCFLGYYNPYDLGPTIQADCDLLSFSQIMDIFAKVGLLSIQHLERNADLQENTLQVYKIQLGYMAVRQPDNVNAYYYVPVWDFYGYRVLFGTGGYAHGKDDGFVMQGNSELTINAIDGTIIDRRYGY